MEKELNALLSDLVVEYHKAAEFSLVPERKSFL